jgi:hypothetical protein
MRGVRKTSKDAGHRQDIDRHGITLLPDQDKDPAMKGRKMNSQGESGPLVKPQNPNHYNRITNPIS